MAYRKRMKKTRQKSALKFTMSPSDWPDQPRGSCPEGMKKNPNWKEDGVMCIIDPDSITSPSSQHGNKGGLVLTQPTKASKRSRAHRGRRRRFGYYMHLSAAGCKDDFDCPNPLDICDNGVCVKMSSGKSPKRRRKVSKGRARSIARGKRRRRR